MLSRIREEVVFFMEYHDLFSKLKDKDWYEMEDALVELCEKVSGKKDDTYIDNETRNDKIIIKEITEKWVGSVANEWEVESFINDILETGLQYFGDIIPLVNKYFGCWNNDGEIDGLAMEIEEYFEK